MSEGNKFKNDANVSIVVTALHFTPFTPRSAGGDLATQTDFCHQMGVLAEIEWEGACTRGRDKLGCKQ